MCNQERPYVMLRHGKNYTGNNRFYGFSMDLLEEIARISSFSYIVDINPDGAYGVKNPITGEWNGVVKQLMSHVSSTRSFHVHIRDHIINCSSKFISFFRKYLHARRIVVEMCGFIKLL